MSKPFISLLIALAALASAGQAFACPEGFKACGETNQLCCPIQP